MSSKLKIGVSGGIGSGKTYVCHLIEQRGFPVYYSDLAAKRLMHESTFIKEQLINRFGQQVYLDGQLNRSFLAEIIFHNEEERAFVNNVVHPTVQSDFENWVEKTESKLLFYESALLFDSKVYTSFDATILVTAPFSLRMERTMKRDGVTEESVKARIESQGNQDEYRALATFCIENDDDHDLVKQLDAILDKLL